MTALAQGLRELADWIDANEDVIPEFGLTKHEVMVVCNSRDELAAAVRTGGKWQKTQNDSYYTVTRSFGPVDLQFFVSRQKVCKRVVVGTIEHPEKVVPAHVEEVVEWVCEEPLLATKEATA